MAWAGGSWRHLGCLTPMGDNEQTIIRICEEAVERVSSATGDAEVGCLFRYGDTLRHVAHRGDLRLIYEVPHG